MRITIVLGAFLPVPPTMGGALEKIWFALASEFARRGHEVVEISRVLPHLPATETIDDVRHQRVPGFDTPASMLRLKFLDLLYSLRVRSRLPASEIIVTNTFWLPMLLRSGRHGNVYVHVGRFPKGQMRFYGRAARLQTPSCAVAEAVKAEVPELGAKVCVIPYPRLAPNSECEAPSLDGRPHNILYVGRIHPEKGVHLLVAAFAALPREFDRWKLKIVGPMEAKFGGGGSDYLQRLQKLAEPQKTRIEFGRATFDEPALSREYHGTRLFVYPSLAEKGESFGLAPLEAMAHGCAVLVSGLGCFRDFVLNNETGFTFDHQTAEPIAALTSKLAELLRAENQLAGVARAGYLATRSFSLEKVAEMFLADFEKIIAAPDERSTNR